MNYDNIIIDTSSLFHRLYYGYKDLEKDPNKIPVIGEVKQNGQIYNAYVTTLRAYIIATKNLREAFPQSKLIHVLDPSSHDQLFKKSLNPEYKANRPEKDFDLTNQLNLLPKVLECFGEFFLKSERLEADDVMASLAYKLSQNETVLLYSRDKDVFQAMYNENIHIMREFKKTADGFDVELYRTPEDVKEKMGVYPNQIAEYLCLQGDKEDNIKGVPQIGPKTAVRLLNTFGSIPQIIENIENMKDGVVKNNLMNNIELLTDNFLLTITRFNVKLPDLVATEQKCRNTNENKIEHAIKFLKLPYDIYIKLQKKKVINRPTP